MQRNVSEQLCVNILEHFTQPMPEPTMGHDPVGICTIFFWNIQCNYRLSQDTEVRDHLICTRL